MKLRSFFYALAAVAIALLLIAAGGFYWLTAQSPLTLLRGGTAAPSAAIFVSKQAPVVLSLLANPDRLEGFRLLAAAPAERRRSHSELRQIKESWLAGTGLEYRRDIQPWLGEEITLAVTSWDFDRDKLNSQQPGYLLVATTKNAQRSQEFLELFWQQQALAGADLAFDSYQGVKLISSASVATAAVGDRYILFANHPKVLREAINNVQATDLNLTNEGAYQAAWQNLAQPKIGLAYLNLAALSGNTQPKSLGISLSLNSQGLLAETAAITGNGESVTPSLNQPVGALDYLPASSGLAIAGSNLSQFWTEFSGTLAGNNALAQLIAESITTWESQLGIQLSQDIFSWVEGEYALALLPRTDGKAADWVFVAEKSAAAETGIAHLDAIAKQQGFSIGNLPLGEKEIIGWTKLKTASTTIKKNQPPFELNAQIQGVRADVGKYEIFATSVAAINQALQAPNNSLADSGEFQQAIAPLSRPNNGYVYLNWPASQATLDRQFPVLSIIELAGKPLFTNLRGLTVSSYGKEAGVQKAAVFFHLGMVKN